MTPLNELVQGWQNLYKALVIEASMEWCSCVDGLIIEVSGYRKSD